MNFRIVKGFDGISADVRVTWVAPKGFSPTAALTGQGFTGEPGQLGVAATDAVFVGMGKTVTREQLREAMGSVLAAALRLGARRVAIEVPAVADAAEAGEAMTEAALLFAYRFVTYKKGPEHRMEEVTFVVDGKRLARFVKAHERACAVGEGVTLARDLVNLPPHDISPEGLAKVARDIAKASKGRIKATVLDREACVERSMGAYLAVAQGSAMPPQFIHLTYTPPKKTKKAVALVGKGITFDSGGLSLKPSASMLTMKCDMSGAAAVLGVFAAITALQPKVTVHGIIAAAENMPSGTAMRPGDIVRASNGKTIEIIDTDAEGRLTLADALHYAAELQPNAIIDLATLTGACVVALGDEIAGLFTNDTKLGSDIEEAAEVSGEKFWELPLDKKFRSQIESDVADLRNLGQTRYAGASTAAAFLREFVQDVPWAHLDIAGPAFAEKALTSYIGKGGTGFGVRTLTEYLRRAA